MYTIGVELAGSQIRAALLRTDLAAPRDRTVPAADLEHLRGKVWGKDLAGKIIADAPRQITEIVQICKDLVAHAPNVSANQIKGIGISIIPAVDRRSGRMIATDTFRAHPVDFKVPAIAALHREFGDVKVEVYQRSQAGAWGEYAFGLGSESRSPDSTLTYITVSYYVNLGVVIGGQLFGGSRGLAGQFAHIAVEPMGPKCPACYQHGCVWIMASGYAIARDFAEKYVRHGHGKKVLEIIQSRNPRDTGKFDLAGTFMTSVDDREVVVDGHAVVDAAQAGDLEARKIVERAGIYMGRGVAQVINTFNPDIVAMGALGARSSVMIDALLTESKHATINAAWANTTIQQSQHDDMTPIIGAALLARP